MCLQRVWYIIRHIAKDEEGKNELHRGLIKLAWLLKHNTQKYRIWYLHPAKQGGIWKESPFPKTKFSVASTAAFREVAARACILLRRIDRENRLQYQSKPLHYFSTYLCSFLYSLYPSLLCNIWYVTLTVSVIVRPMHKHIQKNKK